MKHVFRSSTEEEMPMLEERLAVLREAGKVLYEVVPSFLFRRPPVTPCLRAQSLRLFHSYSILSCPSV